MNQSKTVPVNLRILDKDYVLACPEEECDTLRASARYLNQKVQEVKEGGKVVGSERMVVVSALNIIHEFLQYKQQTEQLDTHFLRLAEKVNLALDSIKS